jgi:hypothetical protein
MQKFAFLARPLFPVLAFVVGAAAVSASACEGGYRYGSHREYYQPYHGCDYGYGRKVVVVVETPVKQDAVFVQPKVISEGPASVQAPRQVVAETLAPAKVETPAVVETPTKLEAPAPVSEVPVQK